MTDEERCEICGEPVREDQDAAEMCDPLAERAIYCHAECGLARGLQIA